MISRRLSTTQSRRAIAADLLLITLALPTEPLVFGTTLGEGGKRTVRFF